MDIDKLLRSNSVTEDRARIQSVRDKLFGRTLKNAPPHIEMRRQIGKGSFGRVYLATDRRLDRTIALKVIPFSRDDEKLRFDREAHALARLCHPNVVQLFESGQADHGVYYLALEHVAGEPLGQWLEARRRSLDEILEVFLQIARGLLEAHRRSLVHRDFKPSNVMVRRDGVAKVLDFGLVTLTPEGHAEARRRRLDLVGPTDPEIDDGRRHSASGSAPVPTPNEADGTDPAAEEDRGPLERSLTTKGGLVGTLPYASPEQLGARPVDARSDQFSFCVTMFEACYGFHPFGRSTPDQPIPLFERRRRIDEGEIQAGKPVRRVPRWLRDLLLRGLHPNPDERHADLKEVIDQLEARLRPPATPIRNALVGAGIALTMLCGSAAALWSERDSLQWDHERWDPIAHRLEQLYGPVARINNYPERWQAVADDLHHRWRPWNQLDAQYQCLRQGRSMLQAEVDTLLAEADAPHRTIFGHRPRLHTAHLYDPEDCLADQPQPPSPEVTDPLLRARHLHREGRNAEALALLEEVRAQVPTNGELLSGVVDRLRASVLLALRDPSAWEVLELARHGNGGDLDFLIETTIERAETGILLDRPRHEIDALLDQATQWESGRSFARTDSPRDRRIEGLHRLVEGHAALIDGRYEAAIAHYRRARERLAALAIAAETDPGVAYIDLQTAAAMATRDSDRAEVRRLVEGSFRVLRRDLGDDHPALPGYALMAANALCMSGHVARAREMLELTQRLGPSLEAIRAEAELVYLDIRDEPELIAAHPTQLRRRAEELEQAMDAYLDTGRAVRDKEAARVWYVVTLAYDQAGAHRMALRALPRWLGSAHDERERGRGCAALDEMRQRFDHDGTGSEDREPTNSKEREIFGALKSECS